MQYITFDFYAAARNAMLFSYCSWITGFNDPKAVAITATIEVALLPIVEEVYQRIVGKSHNEKSRTEMLKELVTYFSLSGALAIVSAKISKKLGYQVNIPRYLLVANLSTTLYRFIQHRCGNMLLLEQIV